MLDIQTMLAPKGSAARPGYSLRPKYITIHNTANDNKGAGAVSHGRYLQGAGAKKAVSYHYVIDDQNIVQIIPDAENAWHAGDGGSGTGNRKSLAIEICENPESDLSRATDNAAELTARLMRTYGIPIENVVQHHRWSGKDCPRRIRRGEPYTWSVFLSRVKAFYNAPTDKPTDTAQSPPDAPDTAGGHTLAPTENMPQTGAQGGADGTQDASGSSASSTQSAARQTSRRYLGVSGGDALQMLSAAIRLGLGTLADIRIGPASTGDDRALTALADKLKLVYEEV